MATEKQKMVRAREILNLIIEGNDPFSGVEIANDSFLQDPKMIRCLHYVVNVLTDNIEGTTKKATKLPPFFISDDELANVRLPDEDIGINDFCRFVNEAVDLTTRKKLTGVKINNQLKKMGILTTTKDEEGKSRTIPVEEAYKYGIKMERINYGGNEYDKVVYNDEGKQFLLNNLQAILGFEGKDTQ